MKDTTSIAVLALAFSIGACTQSADAPSDSSDDALRWCGGTDGGTKSDGGTTTSDSGTGSSDAGSSSTDAGDTSSDAGSTSPDSGSTGGGGGHWQPNTSSLPWQWEISHEIKTSSTTDMGTGDTTYAGAPAAAPLVYDIDGFDNTAADVAALHALGKKVICYIEVGAAENYRPDYGSFPASVLGSSVDGYPSERYIDIRSATVLSIIEARIAMCAQKGFDGIEPDIDDSYTDNTGFSISMADNVAYLTTLSSYAHGLGLAWGLKNGADGGNPSSFIGQVLPLVDFAVVEEPFYLKTIGYFEPAFYDAGKALFVAEYTNDTSSASSFCPQALSDHTNAALFDVGLDGKVRVPCQ